MKKYYYSKAQKESFHKYLEKNDLVVMAIRIPRKKRRQYQLAAARAGKSLVQYITDILDMAEPDAAEDKQSF